jgi:hypothetical protein
MDDIADTQHRRRAERVDVRLARQATRAVKPIRSRLQALQVRAAYLKALAQHRRSENQPVDAIIAEADGIGREIAAHQAALELCGAGLPEPVRRHSRFQDVVRALGTAAEAVRAVSVAR